MEATPSQSSFDETPPPPLCPPPRPERLLWSDSFRSSDLIPSPRGSISLFRNVVLMLPRGRVCILTLPFGWSHVTLTRKRSETKPRSLKEWKYSSLHTAATSLLRPDITWSYWRWCLFEKDLLNDKKAKSLPEVQTERLWGKKRERGAVCAWNAFCSERGKSGSRGTDCWKLAL
jgi:hypothetical protein